MADNPLVQFWNDTLTAANAAKQDADTKLKAAQDDLKAKRDALAAASAALKVAQQKITDIRSKLANIPTGADGQVLLDQFHQATLDLRQAQGAVVLAEADVASSTADNAKAAAHVSGASAAVASATSSLAGAKPLAATRDALKESAGRAPASTLKADAQNALANPPATTAGDRLKNDFPAPLFKRAEAGAASEFGRLNRLQDTASTAEDLISTARGAVDKARLGLSRAVAQLQACVQDGAKNLSQAVQTLGSVADPNRAALTADEINSIASKDKNGVVDAHLQQARSDAADHSTAVVNGQAKVDDLQADLDQARLNARAKGLDDAGVEADAAVTAARDALTQPTADLNDAKNHFTAADKAALADWVAAVPDANWQLFADFSSASSTLDDLSADDAAALTQKVTDAENALVTALTSSLKDAAAPIREESARLSSVRDAQQTALSRRAFSALRGDF
jgi:hypothetical protein